MTVGELVLETLSTGVITEDEVTWLTDHLQTFTRPEEAAAIRLGRLMDEGQVNLGCRVSKRWLHHREVLVDWIEPLGRHSWSVLSVATQMPLLMAKFSDSSILRSARLSRSLIAKPHTNFWFIFIYSLWTIPFSQRLCISHSFLIGYDDIFIVCE